MAPVVFPNSPEIRFAPDTGQAALVSLDAQASSFEPNILALIANESYGGCSLIMDHGDGLRLGDECMCKVGRLAPTLAQIIWLRDDAETDTTVVGLRYLD